MRRLSAVAYASFLLRNRLKSRFEVEHKLIEKKYPKDEIQSALLKLEEIGAIDDIRFAKAYANDKLKFSRRGKFRISLELLQKGVSKDFIEQAVSDINDDSELASAKELVEARLRTWQHLDPQTRKRRLIALLQRRGFGSGVIKQLLI